VSETKFTPGPWRWNRKSNIGNVIEGPSGRTSYDGGDGYSSVAMVQHCGSSGNYKVEKENQEANLHLVAAAPELYDVADRAPTPPIWTDLDDVRAFVNLYINWYADRAAALAKARGEA